MKSAVCFTSLTAIFLTILIATSWAEDKPDLFKIDTLFTVSKSVSKNESGEFALLHGGILLKAGRPEACFDLVLARGGKPELVYLILFQPEKLPGKFNVSMNVTSVDEFSSGKYSIRLAEKSFDVTYDYKLDKQAGMVKDRKITLGERDWKADGPRVFLADASGEKLVLKAVEVKLPEEIPSPAGEDIKGEMRKIIAAISRESAEARKFLGGDADK